MMAHVIGGVFMLGGLVAVVIGSVASGETWMMGVACGMASMWLGFFIAELGG